MKLKTDYCDNFIYENDSLKQTLVEGGYILYVYPQGTSPTNQATDISQLTPIYHFYVRDHLGNNRLVMNENGAIEQVSHYYPFGGLMGESQDITSTQRYKYNGKELDRMHGLDWYDYGARHYDASIGRWMCVDPMAEKYYHVSPYAYCLSNPIKLIDIDGRAPGDAFKTMDDAAVDFGRIYNYWSVSTSPKYPYGVEYSCTFYSFVNNDGELRYSYYASGPQGYANANHSKDDKSQVPNNRWETFKVVGAGHTHGGYHPDYGKGNDSFSRMDLDGDIENQKTHPNYTSGYLCTPSGKLLKHWYNTKTKKWAIITLKGEKFQLPSDIGDKSHNRYTQRYIYDKYDRSSFWNKLFKGFKSYLSNQKYKE